jgi:hypothetical protein
MLLEAATPALQAETGQDAWLRYAPPRMLARAKYEVLPGGGCAGAFGGADGGRDEMVHGVRE